MEHSLSENNFKTAYADYNIKNQAKLSFLPSKDNYGIQFADIIAGVFMRHVYAVSYGLEVYSEFSEIYQRIINYPDKVHKGVNLVIPSRDRHKLSICGRDLFR